MDLDKTVNNLLKIDERIDIDYKPVGFLYTDKKNNKYQIVAFILDHEIEMRIKPEYVDAE